MRKQMKSLQDKNNSYMQQTISMEEVRICFVIGFLYYVAVFMFQMVYRLKQDTAMKTCYFVLKLAGDL